MITENGELEFEDGRRLVAFSRPKEPNGTVTIFVCDGGSQAYGTLTIEQIETALRYAKGEDVGEPAR